MTFDERVTFHLLQAMTDAEVRVALASGRGVAATVFLPASGLGPMAGASAHPAPSAIMKWITKQLRPAAHTVACPG